MKGSEEEREFLSRLSLGMGKKKMVAGSLVVVGEFGGHRWITQP